MTITDTRFDIAHELVRRGAIPGFASVQGDPRIIFARSDQGDILISTRVIDKESECLIVEVYDPGAFALEDPLITETLRIDSPQKYKSGLDRLMELI